MIRSHFEGVPNRRIAIIELPRPQAARLGIIRPGEPARDTAVAWTTVSNEPAESSANFIAMTINRQNLASTQTPGLLTFTPANTTPAPNVAPWNSWLDPNCLPPGVAAPPTPTAQLAPAADPVSKWLIFAGLIGGLAALKAMVGGRK